MKAENRQLRPGLTGAAAAARRRSLLLISLLIAAFGVLNQGFPAALAKSPEPRPDKAPHSRAVAPNGQLTIVKIEPDAKNEEVRIFFSKPVLLDSLRANLRLLPLVKINWRQSTLDREGRLTLKARFKYGVGYVVSLPENFSLAGQPYVPTVNTFFMPDRPPKLEFVGAKSLIELDSRELLHVKVQNIKTLMLEGLRLPPLLLPRALAVEDSPEDWDRTLAELKDGAAQLKQLTKGNKTLAPFLSEPWVEKQLFSAPGEKNKPLAVSLPLSFRRDKQAGALELIRVREEQAEEGAASNPRVFRITNLGLTYKLGDNQLLLWVTSLQDARPQVGVEVVGLTREMEAFPLGRTDKDGILIFRSRVVEGWSLKTLGDFRPVKRRLDQGDLVSLLAGTPSDISYIQLKPADRLKPRGIWQVRTGEKIRRLKGQVFTERGIYRPGETVHFKGLVREYQAGRIYSPQGDVCTFEITNPKGEKVFSGEQTLSEFGSAAGEMTAAGHWPRGTYTLTMTFGPKEEAAKPKEESESSEAGGGVEAAGNAPKNEATCTFQVQEFKAPRHYVEIDFKRLTREETGYVNLKRSQEFVRIGLIGAYYAGGPVKHGQVRWKVHKSKTSYRVPGYDNFVFGYTGEEPGELIESGQAILDEKGRTEIEFPLDRQVLAGESGYLVIATVVDFDGRAASNSQNFQVEPDYLVGILGHPEQVQPDTEQVLKVVAVTRQGKPITKGRILAEVLEKSWAYVAKRNAAGDVYWTDQQTWRKSSTSNLDLESGEATFRYNFGWYGSYRVAFTYVDEKGRSFASATGYQVSGAGLYEEPENKEKAYQILPMSADRPAYEPGQQARISLQPPRPVTCYLVTLEQEGLLEHRVITAKKASEDLEIPIRAEYAPNVYLSVLGLTPRGEFPVFSGRYDIEAPGFYWGNLNLPVRLKVEQLQVQINPGVKELRAAPGAKVNLDFIVHDQKGRGVAAEMAVAVVDEAVLALTGFKTPTLDSLTRFDGPLGVFTGELRAWLMHQTPFYLARIDTLTGGGGLNAAMLAKLRRRFEPVAYFNPALRTDPQGRAQVTFELPDNMTSYRIYAVAADRGSGFASPERSLVATKDFYLEPGLPSFFNQGDRFRFQVAAFNNTSARGPVQFRATSEGGLSLKAEEPSQLLQSKDSLKLNVSGEAAQTGEATARFGAEFQGHADAVELKLPINSGHLRDTEVFSGTLSGLSQVKLSLPPYLTGEPAQKINPEEVQAVLTLSGSPFLRLGQATRYLLTYPYGCIEQTSSGVLALAALRGVVRDGLMPGLELPEVDKFLNRGVTRILNMQTASGGFGYWPGQSETSGWGSIYAGAALSFARQNGVEVPAAALDQALKYFKEQLAKPKTPEEARAFAAYILALNQALDRDAFKSLAGSYSRNRREGKLLLLLAAREANLRSPAELQRDLKPLLGPDITKETHWGWDEFNARARGPALALLAAKAIMPEDRLTKQAALLLLGGLDRQGIWTSTSDTGWALVALGAYFQGQKLGTRPAELTIRQPGVPEAQQVKLDPRGFRTVSLDSRALLKDPVVQVETEAGPTWLYKLELTAPRLDLAGAGADQGFKLSKTIRNTDGSGEIKVGDLVKVTVRLEASKPQRYVVLDDPLPAGLVAINSALKTEQILPEGEEGNGELLSYVTADGTMLYYPNFFEIRDDRVLAFRDRVYSGKYRFEYYARAVCAGQFVAPATKAAAMYSPGVYGYTPRSELTVQGR